ncbi:malectin-A [Scaptodrosophila lebanonensis]|uniref:Malectin-A n=1 Tax=Drosophila lebanonensis TaxID=7225 RepID=A0A6J2U4S0_DROLE|nr:malectin-A [Scaptodrosophila lebanonensis]XP_030382931.1 malectin-A [Scaptodrosophila lebanonensis]
MKKTKMTIKTTTKSSSSNGKCNDVADYHLNRNYLRASSPTFAILLLTVLFVCLLPAALAENLKVVYAVNAGGDDHTDRNGIHYEADPLRIGIASDYGKHLLMIGRVHEQDEVLYRTERYHTTTFGYDFPTDGDGDYALIMKFCEVYFDAPNRKVFDVVLNRKHTVVRQLDIYNQVGRGTAHDEIIYFKISNGRLQYKHEESDVRNGRLRLEFIKGALDNPKINAFALLKGDFESLPRLQNVEVADEKDAVGQVNEPEVRKPVPQQQHVEPSARYDDFDYGEDADELLDDEEPEQQNRQQQQHQLPQGAPKAKRVQSGPRQPNPYSMDDSSILLPVFIAIGAFIPLLFCLCKL